MIRLRPMSSSDWEAVREIYRLGIEEGDATFETNPPEWSHFDGGKLTTPRLVAVEEAGSVVGWVAASPVSTRPAYRGVVEHSVYVDRAARGRGVGRLLLDAFIAQAEEVGVWTIQASIFPENTASLRLHEAAGFRVVGRREKIARSTLGTHAGRWCDTLLVERRSAKTGHD